VAVTVQGSIGTTAGSVSLYNVKQAAPDAFNSGINTAGLASTSVTTLAANSWIVDTYVSGNAISDLAPAGTQSLLWVRDGGSGATTSGGMSYLVKAAAGAQSMTWVHTGENRSDEVAAAFAPIVDATAPTSSLSFTEGTNPGGQYELSTGSHAWSYYYNPASTGTFTMTDAASDAGSGIDQVEFPGLSSTGFTGTGVVLSASPYTSNAYTWTSSNTTAPSNQTVNVFDTVGNLTRETVTFVRDTTGPTATSALSGGPYYSTLSVPVTLSSSDSQSGVATTQVQRDSATLSNGACGTFSGTWSNMTLSVGADTTVASGSCYHYRYVVTDNVANQTTSTQTADAKVDNSAPAAPGLAYSAMTNMSATVNALFYRPGAAGGFTATASATDAQSGIASYTFPTLPAGWTVSGSGAARSWTYTINPTAPLGNQNVTATNNAGLTSSATAFTVTADSTAPSGQSVTITGGYYTTLSVPLTLANGSDAGSGINAASGVVKRASATLSGGACGTFGGFTTTVTPSGGADTTVATGNCYEYQYLISDNVGNQSAASATSAVAKIDVNAPSVVADSYSTNEDVQLNVVAPGVLSNDTDVEHGALTASLVTNVSHGSLGLNSDGSFSYTPAANYNGTDSFTYRASDGAWNSAAATVTITINAVNDAPVNTVPAGQSTAVNMAITFSSGGGNAISIADVDAGSSPMQVQLTATSGTLTLSGTSGLTFTVGNGTANATMTFTGTITNINTALNGMTFTPTSQFTGTATVQIITNDQGATGSGGALSDTDSVSISVINAPPTAAADSYSTTQGNSLVVAVPGVLANDTDPNPGQTLTVDTPRPFSAPTNGTLTLNADGSFTYTPNAGFTGTDSFTYKTTDGIADSSAATVTITVNTTAYVSASSWPTTFTASRYLEVTFPGYVPAGATVTGATFHHAYRSYSGGTTCYYIEVYSSATLIGTHGSSSSPISCNSSSTFVTDTISLPEVNTPARADALTVRLYVWNSTGGRSEHSQATIGVTYWLA
jgi:VCBS repeat-containing protein